MSAWTGQPGADVVVVGAGIVGASIAYHLAEAGAGRVLVLDKSSAASGATGRSSALVRMHYAFRPEVELALESLRYFTGWKERFDRPEVYRATGFVQIVRPEEVDRLRANVAMQRHCGVDTRLVEGKELAALLPGWDLEDVEVAAWEPGSGHGDPATISGDLLDAARERGVEYRPRTAVRGLTVDGGRIGGVDTEAGRIGAGAVVVATGAWSGPLLAGVGAELPLETEYHEVGFFERGELFEGHHPACIDNRLEIYFRSEGESRTLVGDFQGRRGADPDDYPQRPDLDSLARQVRLLSRRMPVMEEAGIVGGITGIYSMTPDARPLIGEIPGVEGLHCAVGFSGMGFKIAPAVGRCLAELIVDGEYRTVDLTPFAPGRFDEGRPIVADHEYG